MAHILKYAPKNGETYPGVPARDLHPDELNDQPEWVVRSLLEAEDGPYYWVDTDEKPAETDQEQDQPATETPQPVDQPTTSGRRK